MKCVTCVQVELKSYPVKSYEFIAIMLLLYKLFSLLFLFSKVLALATFRHSIANIHVLPSTALCICIYCPILYNNLCSMELTKWAKWNFNSWTSVEINEFLYWGLLNLFIYLLYEPTFDMWVYFQIFVGQTVSISIYVWPDGNVFNSIQFTLKLISFLSSIQ